MFWGWENTGVTLRRAGTRKKGRGENIATVLRPFPWHPTHLNLTQSSLNPKHSLQCRRFLRAGKCFCSRKRHVETFRREEEYFHSSQSSTVLKSKMAAITILRTRTMFRPPKIRLHCKLPKTPSCKQQLGMSLLLLGSLNKYDDLGTLTIRQR